MSAKILDQQQALESFFDSLMHDVEAYAENEVPQKEATPAVTPDSMVENNASQRVVNLQPIISPVGEKPKLPEAQVESRPVLIKEEINKVFETLPPVAPPEVELKIKETTEVAAEEIIAATTQLEEQPQSKTHIGKPDWAEEEFQAMLFKVAGLTLAVPLVELNGIVEWKDENITRMPGHADFYLGLMSHLGKNIPLVDTARLVLPPDKLSKFVGENPLERLTRVVLINDGQYGLACDEVDEVITLKPDDVRWRSERTQRKWLAGTVVEHMCALLDAQAFAELLANKAPVDEFRD